MSTYLRARDINIIIAILILLSFFIGYTLFGEQVEKELGLTKRVNYVQPKEFFLESGQKGVYELEVSNPREALDVISKNISNLGATISSTNFGEGDNYAKVIILAPKENFSAIEESIKKVGMLKRSKAIPLVEETGEINYETRLEFYRDLEEKYKANLQQNYSVSQLDLIQKKLEEVRGKIEELEEKSKQAEFEKNIYVIKLILLKGVKQTGGMPLIVRKSVNIAAKFLMSGLLGFLILLIVLVPVYLIVKLFMFLLRILGLRSSHSSHYYHRKHKHSSSRKKKVRKPSLDLTESEENEE